jgi:tetratricopeptide (TPR) repeat protein
MFPRSPEETQALNALSQSQGNPDAVSRNAEDKLAKYPNTALKELVLSLAATAYQQKGNSGKARTYTEQAYELNPRNFQVTDLLGNIVVNSIRDDDPKKEEDLAKADHCFRQTIETLKRGAVAGFFAEANGLQWVRDWISAP